MIAPVSASAGDVPKTRNVLMSSGMTTAIPMIATPAAASTGATASRAARTMRRGRRTCTSASSPATPAAVASSHAAPA